MIIDVFLAEFELVARWMAMDPTASWLRASEAQIVGMNIYICKYICKYIYK
jgi:hypothetical protein